MTSARRVWRPLVPRSRLALLASSVLLLSACSAAVAGTGGATSSPAAGTWAHTLAAARGQSVSLWMWSGDPQGNAYVDDVLAPAAAALGVTLKRVPITDTKDAIDRIAAEKQAGVTDGSVDLVWVNGDNFSTGRQAGLWACGWTSQLPSMTYVDPNDPLITHDFGTPVDGCEAPWHKAQFTFVYDSARVSDPPRSLLGLLAWAKAHPGRFTYPAPPDFTGSVFVREALYATAGGYRSVPASPDGSKATSEADALWSALSGLAPSLWRQGATYPKDSMALDQLFAGGQVDFTMTYGPATLTGLVDRGTFPRTTRVLPLDEGTVGNANFLAIPSTSGHQAAAEVVADLALSPAQQLAAAQPSVWGQFTVLDQSRLTPGDRAAFTALPASAVVPPYVELSRNANPELAATWVPVLDDGWRRHVLAGGA
ncbi:MAG: ABC transporter substrate-binding protein [Frankiales bacterium]|nr:ABC transporter substrate-binding protein [Frankiales bacterium]